MKYPSLRQFAALLVALFSSAGLAQAHPGHSVLDWFSALPHAGHGSEYAALLLALSLTGAVFGACWLASRKR